MKILIAKEGYTVTQILEAINQIASSYWQAQGYTVDESGVTGKKQGQDNPDAQKTVTWDNIRTAPDSTQYITSLSNDPRFVDWEDYWSAAGLPDMYEEIDFPVEWVQSES